MARQGMPQSIKTKTVALGGILLALSSATLVLASFIPGVELTLYAISSLYAAIMIIETNIIGGFAVYTASGILSLLLIPNKMAILPYIFFFGIYGIVKNLIEKIGKQPIEVCLKLLFFNISFGTGIFLFNELFLGSMKLPDYHSGLLAFGAQLLFLLYDYIFTLLIVFYRRRIPKP